MKQQEDKKEQIIQAAIRRFSHFGIAKTTMNEIAEDIHLTKANLYYYYPDKISLLKEVVLQVTDELLAEQKNALSDKYQDNVLDSLLTFLEVQNDFIRRYYMINMSENIDWVKDYDLENLSTGVIEKVEALIACILDEGIKRAELKENIDVEKVSSLYMNLMRGLSLKCNISNIVRGFPDPSNLDEILQEQKDATLLLYNGLKN